MKKTIYTGQTSIALPESGNNVKFRNVFHTWLERKGKVIWENYHFNGITTEGKNKLLGSAFNAETVVTTWFCGLINLSGFTALADADTYDDIDQAGNGWDSFQSYTDGNNADNTTTRPDWQPDSPSAGSITNTTVMVFNITGSGTVKGLFVVGGGTAPQTKGNHAPGSTLWATSLFTGGDVVVANADTLKSTYTVNA